MFKKKAKKKAMEFCQSIVADMDEQSALLQVDYVLGDKSKTLTIVKFLMACDLAEFTTNGRDDSTLFYAATALAYQHFVRAGVKAIPATSRNHAKLIEL